MGKEESSGGNGHRIGKGRYRASCFSFFLRHLMVLLVTTNAAEFAMKQPIPPLVSTKHTISMFVRSKPQYPKSCGTPSWRKRFWHWSHNTMKFLLSFMRTTFLNLDTASDRRSVCIPKSASTPEKLSVHTRIAANRMGKPVALWMTPIACAIGAVSPPWFLGWQLKLLVWWTWTFD